MTTRSFIASVVCAISLVACGGGGGNNNGDDGDDDDNGLCGNGSLDGGEACDDRNSVDNDGCTACAIDAGYNCQGSPSVCIMGEFPVFEDGSCASPFTVELTGSGATLAGTASGDTSMSTNQVGEADCNGDDFAGAGNDVVFKFTTTMVSDVHIVGPDPAPFDMVLRVTTAACNAAMQVPDNVGDGCIDEIFSVEELHFTALPAGTYFLIVDGYYDDESGPFSVSISTDPATCGDGVVDADEECDDNDLDSDDGCSNACLVEFGFTCQGEPSVCESACGNGVIDTEYFEQCDDSDADAGDGCSSSCTIELGYTCQGEPSVCELKCGNGVIETGEECDDDDNDSNDGCSATCTMEPGYVCSGEPSLCANTCGNGAIDAGEECDDGDAMSGDGCSDHCQMESGYVCAGTPSVCANTCGNDVLDANEECDDGLLLDGDLCSDNCQLEYTELEVESNNTTPQEISVILDGDTLVKGSFSAGDVDLYTFTLPTAADVELETYNSVDDGLSYDGYGELVQMNCINGMDTTIHVFPEGVDYTNDANALGSDDNDGDGACSYFGYDPVDPTERMLPAGTYVVKVRNTAAAPVYIFDLYVVP